MGGLAWLFLQLISLEQSLAIASGAAYEFHPVKHGDFDIYKEPRFTDDTVMTLAVATKGMEMQEELARCVYNNVLDDNLRQILNEFNRGY